MADGGEGSVKVKGSDSPLKILAHETVVKICHLSVKSNRDKKGFLVLKCCITLITIRLFDQ